MVPSRGWRAVAALLLFGAPTAWTAAPAAAQTTAPPSPAASAPPKAAACAACHGADGKPLLPAYPVIAGQTARYLYLQLRDFNEGRRNDPLMSPMAKDLTRDEMRALAEWFSQQKRPVQAFAPDAGKARAGKAKCDETLCTMCHLGGFAGQNEVPRVAGQNFDYIVKQLTDFKSRQRSNDAGTMTSVASTLSAGDIVNIAHYLAGL